MLESDAQAITALTGLLRSHMNDFNEQTKVVMEMNGKITLLLQAFPEQGGIIGHRVYHENKLLECEDQRATKRSIKGAVLSKWANAGIVIIILGVWELAKAKLGIK